MTVRTELDLGGRELILQTSINLANESFFMRNVLQRLEKFSKEMAQGDHFVLEGMLIERARRLSLMPIKNGEERRLQHDVIGRVFSMHRVVNEIIINSICSSEVIIRQVNEHQQGRSVDHQLNCYVTAFGHSMVLASMRSTADLEIQDAAMEWDRYSNPPDRLQLEEVSSDDDDLM